MTSSFDKMLSQYQGNLPNISDTNYTSELDYTLTEEVNKEIDNLKEDHAKRTDEAIAIAEQAADSKRKQLESLVGLIGTGKKLYDYWKAKDLASAQYDLWNKKKLKDYDPEFNIDHARKGLKKGEEEFFKTLWSNYPEEDLVEMKKELAEKGYINDKNQITKEGQVWLKKQYQQQVNEGGTEGVITEEQKLANQKLVVQHLKEEAVKDPQFDLQQQLEAVSNNKATADELNARQLQGKLIEDHDSIFPSLLQVKKQLPGMPYPLSYMDVTSKTATAEERALAPVLLRDAHADYEAFNQDYIDKIGEKRYKNEVFPKLYEKAQITHKKFMGLALASAQEQNLDQNAQAFAATFKREGINAVVGSTGSVSVYEQTLDGRRNNSMGFAKSVALINHAVDKGYLTGRDLQDAINTPFPKRGSTKMTTLEELKPDVYNQLQIIAQNDIQEELKRDKAETASDILQQTANIQDQAKAQKWSTDETKEQAMKTWTELAKKHNLSPTNSAFAELNSLATYGQTRAERSGDALLELQGQEARGELLSTDLIARLEPELQQAWKDKVAILGSEGLTTQELEDADAEIVEIIKDYKVHGTIDQRLGPKMRLARTRMLNLYNATFQQLMRSDNREDTLSAKQDNKIKAMDIVKNEFNTIKDKNPDNHSQKIFGNNIVPDYRLEVANEAQLVQFLNTTEKPAESGMYWNAGEQEAIINSLAAEEKGEPISGWWTDKAKYFPNMTGRELFKMRTEATADLREGEVGDIKIEDKFHLRTLAIKPNPAKIGSHIIEPINTENMLTELQVQDADYNSTFRLPETIQEFDPSQMTLRELLQLRVDNYGPWNDDIGLGIYDIQMKELVEMLKIPGVVEELGGGDAVFDETMQKKLMQIKILHKANQAGGMKSFNNSYRKINHITDEEQVAYNGIVSGAYGEELANDPFRQLNTLTSEVAKVALEDVMAYA